MTFTRACGVNDVAPGSSLAVAGLDASERFGISAAQLATFTMLQLLVYAGMQIPVGLLVDRFGPRSVMLTGAVVLALGVKQLLVEI